MVATLQRNNSPRNFLTKSVTDIDTVSINLLDTFGEMGGNVVLTRFSGYHNVNYMTFEGRSYFVTAWEILDAYRIQASLTLDVLRSFAVVIRQQGGIIKRNETLVNFYMNDGQYPLEQKEFSVTKSFGGSVSSAGSYILTVSQGVSE